MKYDVIIVGGGVAGTYLSSLLDDTDVLLLEKNKKAHPKDSGIVSKRIFSFFEKPPIKAEIREMELLPPSGNVTRLRDSSPYAYVLRRRKFGQLLHKKAKRNATIRYEEVKYIKYTDDHVRVETDKGVYYGRILIGADGTASIVRKSAEIKPPKIVAGLMVKTNKKMLGNIQIFFNKYFSPDYFSWIIPISREYGLITAVRPKSYLDYFTRQMYLPKGKLYAYLIPLGYTKSYSYRTLLIGDACGQNKPLTGGGIIFSLTAARFAADTINSTLLENRFTSETFSEYDIKWKRSFGLEIDLQYFARKIYRNMSNKEIDDMFQKTGPNIKNIRGFDYDRLSRLWKVMPKIDMAKIAASKFARAF